VAEGEAEDSASVFLVVVFFLAGDAEDEAELELFFVLEVELFFVVPFVVAEDVVVAASSFLWVWQPRNAVNVSAVIKDKTDVFIVWLSLTEVENVDPRLAGQALKYSVFSLQNDRFFS